MDASMASARVQDRSCLLFLAGGDSFVLRGHRVTFRDMFGH